MALKRSDLDHRVSEIHPIWRKFHALSKGEKPHVSTCCFGRARSLYVPSPKLDIWPKSPFLPMTWIRFDKHCSKTGRDIQKCRTLLKSWENWLKGDDKQRLICSECHSVQPEPEHLAWMKSTVSKYLVRLWLHIARKRLELEPWNSQNPLAQNLTGYPMLQTGGRYLFPFRSSVHFLKIIQVASWKIIQLQLHKRIIFTKMEISLVENLAQNWN